MKWGDTRMSTQRDWAQDYDLFDPEYAADPYPIWAELRTACPAAQTGGGTTIATVLLHLGVFKDSYPDYLREAAADAPA
jgi:hypothetical protein